MITAEERRSEPRIEASTSVLITPLAAVATRLHGSVVNVSTRGVRVHCDTELKELPRAGEVYRVQSRGDQMLCEVRNAAITETGADLGLQIVHWNGAGELKRLLSKTGTRNGNPVFPPGENLIRRILKLLSPGHVSGSVALPGK
jgi:hypothetical protein